jgi:hypothetical protein
MCERWRCEGRKRVARDKGAEACRVARESRTRRRYWSRGKAGSERRCSGERWMGRDATEMV